MEVMDGRFPATVLRSRASRLAAALSAQEGGFDTALIVSRVNQYWLTGTIQDGIVVLRNDGTLSLYVRRSYERAREESPLDSVYPMSSYRDLLAQLPADLGRTWVEAEVMPLAMLERLRKYFRMDGPHPLDRLLTNQRAVKEHDEIALIRHSGVLHRRLLEEEVPQLLREGINEAELCAQIYEASVRLGHHGLSRFSMFQMEMVVGQIGFGVNSLYPTNFDGPGGMKGLHPAMPLLGSRERTLKKGDLVFVDVGFGWLGYHSDKTQVYSFGAPPPAQATAVHTACRTVLERARDALRPGLSAADAYSAGMAVRSPLLAEHFMGYGNAGVKFLGHGVGLYIDEAPVIMAGNETPLEAGMVIALEPKCGVEGAGMVGVEETYLVTPSGAECLTGGDRDIFVV